MKMKKYQYGGSKKTSKDSVESEMFPGKMIPKSKSNYATGRIAKMVEAGKPKPVTKKVIVKKAQAGKSLESKMKSAGKAKADSITNKMKSSADSILKNYKPIFKENNPAYKKAKGGKWIQKAIKKPGALRAQLGAKPGKPIPAGKLAAAAKKPGKLGQRARLAQTLKKMRKK